MGRGLHLLQDLGRFVYVAFVVDVFAQRIDLGAAFLPG